MDIRADVVIVGGGIAGLALAAALANDGVEVVVLEASHEYEDRVRGESMPPWGVAEAQALGAYPALLEAGARLTETWVHYDALVPTEVSLANPIPVGMMLPGVAGSLNLRHPEACSALAKAAVEQGVHLIRGIAEVAVTGGTPPQVRALGTTGEDLNLSPRLVVGADGRNSTVRRQVGFPLQPRAATHIIAGVILDGLDDIALDHDFLVTSDDLFMASFRQHEGQLRVYLAPGLAGRNRFAGRDGMAEFLRSMAIPGLPFGERLAEATPIGPLATYPGDDAWVTEPYCEGIVLIGDAAGYNSPIVGQGLANAMRDACRVRDAFSAGGDPTGHLRGYADERLVRMRSIQAAATFMAAVGADDADDRVARRQRFFQLQVEEPLTMGLLAGLFAGIENAPPEAFDGRLLSRLIGD